MRGGRRSVVGCLVCIAAPSLTLAAMITACAAPYDAPEGPDVSQEIGIVAAPVDLAIEFDFCHALGDPPLGNPCWLEGGVNLRFVSCSAKLSCEDSFLHDPDTLERGPTLVTGFSCGFPSSTPQDALLSYHPDLRCYKSGLLNDRTTWDPPAGILVAPEDSVHLFFSSEAADQGDVYTNSATLMRPLKEASETPASGNDPATFGFCELNAWGSIAFANMDDNNGTRRAEHVPHSPAVKWHAIMQWTDNGWNCHMGAPELTSVERVVLASATHDLPSETDRTVLPASHGVILLREEPLTGIANINNEHPQVAKLRFNTTSRFPLEPDDEPEPMTERQLWITNSAPGDPPVPVDMHIEKTCAQITTSGVTAIGLLVSNVDHIQLGAIIVWPMNDDLDAWDCDRLAPDGDCRLWNQSEWSLEVPCLLPGGS